MKEETPRGTRSLLGPNAGDAVRDEDEHPDARREVVEEAAARTAEEDQPQPDNGES